VLNRIDCEHDYDNDNDRDLRSALDVDNALSPG
jgi:hypothetical protein